MRLLSCAIAGSLIFAGCATGGRSNRIVTIETAPPDALVRVEGFGECTSPCAIEIDAARRVFIAKAGFKPVTIDLSPTSRAKAIAVPLELAAPTEAVEAGSLGDL